MLKYGKKTCSNKPLLKLLEYKGSLVSSKLNT